ncbi:MAG: Ig-like domain-containing protein [Bacteroidota bacterium]
MKTPIHLLTFLALLALLLGSSCANVVAPSGGPKDERPPQLVKQRSTPNLQTNFEKQSIILTFDEWLKLNNPIKQVIISPPLIYKHQVSLKKKSVRFEFNDREQLKDNATYTINFGEAVQDLNEGNAAEDLRFVFSTGPYIDSLQVSGKMVDALTGEPAKEVLLMLYDNLEDSVLRTEKPFYFAKTDESGRFKIQNVRSDTFKVCALKDINLNYIYDQASEQIGFLDSFIVVSDSVQPTLELQVFTEVGPMRLKSSTADDYGLVKLLFNQPPQEVSLQTVTEMPMREWVQYDGDTLKFWYSGSDTSKWQILLQQDTLFYDTVEVRAMSRKAFVQRDSFFLTRALSEETRDFNPVKPIRLRFNHPIYTIDTSLIRFYEDSLRVPIPVKASIDSTERQVLQFEYAWRGGTVYAMELLPGAVSDWYGLRADTLLQNYKALTKDAFGNIKMVISELDSNYNYVLQLLFEENNLVEEVYFGGDTLYENTFKTLPPGNFSVKIIEDRNGNRKWDTGNYDLKEQPEIILQKKLEQLRANWDVDVSISIETLKQQQSRKKENEATRRESGENLRPQTGRG